MAILFKDLDDGSASFAHLRPLMEYNLVSRGPAIYSLHQCWYRFEHWGDVPNSDERLHAFVYYQVFGGLAAEGGRVAPS